MVSSHIQIARSVGKNDYRTLVNIIIMLKIAYKFWQQSVGIGIGVGLLCVGVGIAHTRDSK